MPEPFRIPGIHMTGVRDIVELVNTHGAVDPCGAVLLLCLRDGDPTVAAAEVTDLKGSLADIGETTKIFISPSMHSIKNSLSKRILFPPPSVKREEVFSSLCL